MSKIITLPKTLRTKAVEYVDAELRKDRGYQWATDYHRKLVLMLEEEKDRDLYFSEHDGELVINMRIGIDLEVEQALRALINRIHELEGS